MNFAPPSSRRNFLKITAAGSLAAALAACKRDVPPAGTKPAPTSAAAAAAFSSELPPAPDAATPAPVVRTGPAKIALTTGGQRADNIARALQPLENDIKEALANRRIIIKPNTDSPTNQLASTHADALRPILDLLKSLGKLPFTAIADASPNTRDAFRNFGYDKLAARYNVRLVDLASLPSETVSAISQKDARPHPIRIAAALKVQAANFIISVTPPKTHDRALVALGLENIVSGAVLKEGLTPDQNNKAVLYGDGPRATHTNFAMLAPLLHPSLTIIDGFQGMEGEGPLNGTAVDHKFALASLDFLAADVIATSLIGLNPADVGYLYFLSTTNLGIADTSKMEILGQSVASLTKNYKPHSTTQQQLQWKINARVVGA